MEKATITIIGGGFCGMLTAAHLCKSSDIPLKINIINAKYPFAKGIAYSPYSKSHLLNVPAGKMSVFTDDPDHFMRWLQKNVYSDEMEASLLAKAFLPRHIYGQYLTSVWKEAFENKNREVEVQLVNDYVIDIDLGREKTMVYLKQTLPLKTDYVVLATGNSAPRDPNIPNKSFFSSPNYFANPWMEASVNHIDPDKDILIIGNGLTMVDTVLGIMEKGFKSKIYSLSPHGYSMMSHKNYGVAYNKMKLTTPYSLSKVVSTVKKHIQLTASIGISPEPVIDALRPFVPKIWMSLNQQEKESFLRHLCHKWGIARHRLPVQVYDTIQNLQIKQKLVAISGRIKDITEDKEGISVAFSGSKKERDGMITVGRVINCTGPDCNVMNCENVLLKNLGAKGIIKNDLLKLGMEADPQSGNIIDAQGKLLTNLFTLGANLKGMLWESTAVPELRAQAEKLSMTLINNCRKKRSRVYQAAA